MPSPTYRLFAQAIISRKQILCSYNGHARAVCSVVLGHSKGEEKALVYQFAGGGSTSLPEGGQWKCLSLARVEDVRLRDGPWHSGSSHTRPQSCVEDVDLDVNPASPYTPRRSI